MGSAVASSLWSGLLVGWDWGLWIIFLSCQGSRPEPWICTAHSLGSKSGLNVHWIPWSREVTGIALQMGKAMKCDFCLIATECRTVKLATQLPVYFWIDSLIRQPEAVFSDVFRAINYICCLDAVGDAALKLMKLFVFWLSSSKSIYQVPWPSRFTCFALQTIRSVCSSLAWAPLRPKGLHGFHVFLSALLLRWGCKKLSAVVGDVSASLPR